MASGKSTLARQISDKHSSILISEDVMLAELYPNEIINLSTYVQFSERLKSCMKPILIDLLRSGASVVLDFPANTVKQREWLKDIYVQADSQCEFHYLDTSHATCKAQLEERVVKEPERHATDTAEMYDAITKYFETPLSTEGFEIISHKRD